MERRRPDPDQKGRVIISPDTSPTNRRSIHVGFEFFLGIISWIVFLAVIYGFVETGYLPASAHPERILLFLLVALASLATYTHLV